MFKTLITFSYAKTGFELLKCQPKTITKTIKIAF